MFTTDYAILSINLPELNYTLRLPRTISEPLPLVATTSKPYSKIYYNNSWLWGKWVWSYYYHTEDPIIQQQRLQQAIVETIAVLFERYVKNIYQDYQCYFKSLCCQLRKEIPNPTFAMEEKKRGYSRYLFLALKLKKDEESQLEPFMRGFEDLTLTENESDGIHASVAQCSQLTRPFWRLFLKAKYEAHRLPLASFLDLKSSKGALFNLSFYQSLKRAQCLFNLEAITCQPIPIGSLAKICQTQERSSSEVFTIKCWLKLINEKRKELTIRHFEEALKEIVYILQIEGHAVTFEELASKLEELDCHYLNREDEEQLQWLRGIKSGEKVNCNGKELIVGEPIHLGKHVDEHYCFMTLGPRWLLKSSHHTIHLKIETFRQLSAETDEGITTANIIDNIEEDSTKSPVLGLEAKGRFIVLEKLNHYLAHIVWKSQNFRLDTDEEEWALKLANHIYWMCYECDLTPQNLHPAYLGWDEEGVLKSLVALKFGEFDYNRLEQFCVECARHETTNELNQNIIDYLMHVSKLREHEVAKIYEGAVAYTFHTGLQDWHGRTFPEPFENKTNRIHLKEICQQALDLRKTCFQEVKQHLQQLRCHDYHQDSQLQTKVGFVLSELYRLSSTPGILLPSLKKQLLKLFEKGSEPTLTGVNYEIGRYYRTQFYQIEDHNRECQREAKH